MTAARNTYEAAMVTAAKTRLNSLAAAQATKTAAINGAIAAYNGSAAAYATFAAAIAGAEAAYATSVFAAHSQKLVDEHAAAAALVASDGVGPAGFGGN
jgi:hypothetical protein